MKKILLIDDDMDMCLLLNRFLTREGYIVTEAHSGKDAMQALNQSLPDLVICDLQLGDMEGTAILKIAKEKKSTLPFIIITGYSDILTSMNAIKLGAFDYVAKPLLMEEMKATIKRAIEAAEKQDDMARTGKSAATKQSKHLDAKTTSFNALNKQIDLVAPTEHNVIIYGESGSGKEVAAQEIHKRSKRSRKPFVIVNCNTLSGSSELDMLFADKQGSFHIANGGTLLLDDVTMLSPAAQAAVLSVKQTGKVNGYRNADFDVRILASSNESVWTAVRKRKFSDELYYTLNDFNISVPPLRERKDDIMVFAEHFLKQAITDAEKESISFSADVIPLFENYSWPGNLHELRNVINKAVVTTKTNEITPGSLPAELVTAAKNSVMIKQ
ncbi:sigma-54-dependent transcriptional regulator [Sediminibacterium ginsengisoli]|uniref:DNA-binding transcriptional response regulator, NtrC family, contains REC, AAA-type ATPase, and a Fis-type DNA-binding domains n=1 Tax=Sediminibacterium ginsengisoli TaxID=413434 RepID=A0A1T4PZT4_9BACT|nr:sigma-54 dependent transcriptional regulator [Sediminibacterium ginsengisoli]SJZ97080.1 DNA-binding transcriptional response regulator, NtrC family, contains REC, AAA-type ATPase, and a Fis-type DNA-binding domains [Sediminibacterium ginsengisoli]